MSLYFPLQILGELLYKFIYIARQIDRWASLVAQLVKNLPGMQEMLEIWVQFLGWEDPMEEGMATHSSNLAWRIPWTEEPGRLHSIGCKELDTTQHSTAFRQIDRQIQICMSLSLKFQKQNILTPEITLVFLLKMKSIHGQIVVVMKTISGFSLLSIQSYNSH